MAGSYRHFLLFMGTMVCLMVLHTAQRIDDALFLGKAWTRAVLAMPFAAMMVLAAIMGAIAVRRAGETEAPRRMKTDPIKYVTDLGWVVIAALLGADTWERVCLPALPPSAKAIETALLLGLSAASLGNAVCALRRWAAARAVPRPPRPA